MKRVAIDIETLSLESTANITQVAVVEIGPKPTILVDMIVNDPGGHVDAATVSWWAENGGQAWGPDKGREGTPLYNALAHVSMHIGDADEVYARGGMDFMTLESAWRRESMLGKLMNYRAQRDERTIMAIAGIERDYDGENESPLRHTAIGDATHTAVYVWDALIALEIETP